MAKLEKQDLANPAGPHNLHYCPTHNEICKPYAVWPQIHTMLWSCSQGCRLAQSDTVLKPQEVRKKK